MSNPFASLGGQTSEKTPNLFTKSEQPIFGAKIANKNPFKIDTKPALGFGTTENKPAFGNNAAFGKPIFGSDQKSGVFGTASSTPAFSFSNKNEDIQPKTQNNPFSQVTESKQSF